MDIIISEIRRILGIHFVSSSIAHGLLALGIVAACYIVYSVVSSYFEGQKTGKPISWLKVGDDIRWTLYCWSERDNEYVMSLPRLIYFISALLIIYVVVFDKPSMLTPLLGFNLSAMVSYTGKRYIEEKQDAREDAMEEAEKDRITFTEDFKQKLDELANLGGGCCEPDPCGCAKAEDPEDG